MKQNTKKHRTHAAIKQVNLYEPCIYDKQLGFIKTVVVIGDSLFGDSAAFVF